MTMKTRMKGRESEMNTATVILFRWAATALLGCVLLQAAGCGTSQRAFKKQGRLSVNVCEAPYRAAGDGLTNDRIAIQSAIDDVFVAGGGTVTLPSGRTFLSGEIRLKDSVVLHIDGILKKSNVASHFEHPTVYGRMNPGSSLNWDLCSYVNYPLIYTTSGTTNVTIQGSGALEMNYTGEDKSTIHVASIGLFDTEHFIIKDITINNASQPQIWPVRCRYGEVANVRIANPAPRMNNEAICLCNCQNMRIHHNYSCAATTTSTCGPVTRTNECVSGAVRPTLSPPSISKLTIMSWDRSATEPTSTSCRGGVMRPIRNR